MHTLCYCARSDVAAAAAAAHASILQAALCRPLFLLFIGQAHTNCTCRPVLLIKVLPHLSLNVLVVGCEGSIGLLLLTVHCCAHKTNLHGVTHQQQARVQACWRSGTAQHRKATGIRYSMQVENARRFCIPRTLDPKHLPHGFTPARSDQRCMHSSQIQYGYGFHSSLAVQCSSHWHIHYRFSRLGRPPCHVVQQPSASTVPSSPGAAPRAMRSACV